VHIADDRLHVADDLAFERGEQAQHSVRCGMVRADVDGEQFVVLAQRRHRHRPLALAVGDVERLGHRPGTA